MVPQHKCSRGSGSELPVWLFSLHLGARAKVVGLSLLAVPMFSHSSLDNVDKLFSLYITEQLHFWR